MKKILIFSFAAVFAVGTQFTAQAQKMYKLDNPEVSAANPLTTIKVSVVVEKETIRKGPYARFAQKYLGATAPLNDKDIYTVTDARIGYSDPSYAAGGRDSSPRNAQASQGADRATAMRQSQNTDFPKVNVDRLSSADRSLEDMARDAANMIFTIRKRRFELVSGEVGEQAYGDGMKAAIQELDRMEREYTALFFGKQSKTREMRTFDVVPQSDKTNYIVCRFSQTAGILPDSDLSGTPVVLALVPENVVKPAPAAKNAKSVDYYRVADYVQCTVTGPSGELAKSTIPVYQFGQTISVASPAR